MRSKLINPKSPAAEGASREKFDVDFSLAMHNRTGKYAIGRDLLNHLRAEFRSVKFWILRLESPPAGILAKLICRIQWVQSQFNARSIDFGFKIVGKSTAPILHLEPFTVICNPLRRQDAVLIHDMGPLTHPELFDKKLFKIYQSTFAEIGRVGPHLIFASHSSQREFQRLYYEIVPVSSRVIYPPIHEKIYQGSPRAVNAVRSPYILTVGSIGMRKNQLRCIAAFAKSGLAEHGVTYVICGAREPGFDEVARSAKQTNGVILLDYVDDAELLWLYQNAFCFLLASLLEGFGMPLAEAISNDVVPIVSRNSVLEEVSGGGALLVDPLDENDIAVAIAKRYYMSDSEALERLSLLKKKLTEFSISNFVDQWTVAIHGMEQINLVSSKFMKQNSAL